MKIYHLIKIGIWILVLHWYLVLGAWSLCLASDVSFGVFPPKISIITAPSQTINIPLKIINGADLENFNFSSIQISTNEEGSVVFVNQPDEASSWLKIDGSDLSKAIVKADQNAESQVNLNVEIPKSALQSDHYIALIISSENNDENLTTHSKSIGQIAIPIIISVKGEIVPESLAVESFSIPKISLDPKVPVYLKLKNPGSYLVETVGTITSKGISGKKHQEMLPKTTVLSKSSRVIGGKNFIFNTNSLGPTNITISIQLDQSSPITISKSVFILPKYILVFIIIVVAAFVLVISRKKLKLSPKH